MNTETEPSIYLPRGIDHLGDLGAKLKDLSGFRTLVYELIQNADDARGAAWLTFDVTRDALIVDNNGTFTDCGNVEATGDCPWKLDSSKRSRCDFHRFIYFAGGDKREDENTIGAFGIGFIAVYQITDRPELISNRRHWTLVEENPQNERIKVCSGCNRCQDSHLPGTRFILPWVFDPDTRLRKELRASAVTQDGPSQLIKELRQALPAAFVFLKSLQTIEVKQGGNRLQQLKRVGQPSSVKVHVDGVTHEWHLISGDFDRRAAELKGQFPGSIESKRIAKVTIAIPDKPFDSGQLYAFLPSEHQTELPFHVNADFFPTNDRRRINFGSGYQAEWNKAAIEAAADSLKSNISSLRTTIGHKRLWSIIDSLRAVAEKANKGIQDKSLSLFWKALEPELKKLPLIFTTRREWRYPATCFLLTDSKEEVAIPVLEALDMQLVHSDLRPYHNILTSSSLDIQNLDLPNVIQALERRGLTKRTKMSDLPELLRKEEIIEQLWVELEILLRKVSNNQARNGLVEKLSRCSIAPGRDDAVWPPCQVFRAEDSTIDLFSPLAPDTPFLSSVQTYPDVLRGLTPRFSVINAVEVIASRPSATLEWAWHEGKFNPAKVITWFADQRSEIARYPEKRGKIADLPIFPTRNGLQSLWKLSLPGGFDDPLGLANLVDLPAAGGHRDFIKELGVKELTFLTYAREHIPRAFENKDISSEKKQMAIQLLAERKGALQGNDEVRRALQDSNIVLCTDHQYRRPKEVYFLNEIIKTVLGPHVPNILLPHDSTAAVRDFFRWVGVVEEPRFEDITSRIENLVSHRPTAESVQAIENIWVHLAERLAKPEPNLRALTLLQTLAWLPVRGQRGRWYDPKEVCADFQYHLFASQALFLDIPPRTQQSSVKLLAFLKIRSNPTVNEVVNHLLSFAADGKEVNPAVYKFLCDNADAPEIARLRGRACLYLRGKYVEPQKVFWGEQPFGNYRFALGQGLRKYEDLFSKLGVRDRAGHRDATQVILEISAEYGLSDRKLSDEDKAILKSCWHILGDAMDAGELNKDQLKELEVHRVIPNKAGRLMLPQLVFFEDRAGLAAKFGEALQEHVLGKVEGEWKAMEAVGVRDLGSEIRCNKVECEDPYDDGRVSARIIERRPLLERVLSSNAGENSRSTHAALFDNLRAMSAEDLKIVYSIPKLKPPLSATPMDVHAFFDRATNTLYFNRSGNAIPWASISRELAIILFPDREPGTLASALKEALAGDSFDEAVAVLDEFGFARIEKPSEANSVQPEVIETLGLEAQEEVAVEASGPSNELIVQPGDQANESHKPVTTDQAIRGILGPQAPNPNPMPPASPEKAAASSRMQAGDAKAITSLTPKAPTQQKQGKLRTYVAYTTEPAVGGAPPNANAQQERSEVDRAGIDMVMRYERRCGRQPTKKPHFHAGYDIESKEKSGKTRYIEVKSVSGEWGTQGVALTKREFEEARKHRDQYWLYVVERATSSNGRVHTVRDPAGKANQFFYDDGWRDVAEQEP